MNTNPGMEKAHKRVLQMEEHPPVTEAVNPHTDCLDMLSISDMLSVICAEEVAVQTALQRAIPEIAAVIQHIVAAFQAGKRLLYFGAGTSGRLGVLDASECPPTFGTPPEMVQGIIAGGDIALRYAVEGAEDDAALGAADAKAHVQSGDVVVGISASGNPAYILQVLTAARERGAYTVALTCNPAAKAIEMADAAIVVPVGPEVLAGSSRLKAGTAQKRVLNMLTTGALVQCGYTYGHLMVNVKASNEKLRLRATRLVQQIAEVSEKEAQDALLACEWRVKEAVLLCTHHAKNVLEARTLLKNAGGRLRACLKIQ
jgi:N-acetylmuramic acid 6-phosphate etherase